MDMAAQEQSLFRQWRLHEGLTQRQAAEKLGYGITKIWEYDTGRARPDYVVLLAMTAVSLKLPPFSAKDAA